jgi:hypothetical protein
VRVEGSFERLFLCVEGEKPALRRRISYDAGAAGAKVKGTVTEVRLASATAA